MIPFAFWALIMIVFKVSVGSLKVDKWSITNIVNIIFTNKEESTYYFMFSIMGVYLTLPAISILSDKKYRKVLWYIVIVMFITKSSLPVLLKVINISYNNSLTILFDGYIMFVILGYLLSTIEIKKKHRYTLYALGIMSCLLRYFTKLFLSTSDGKINKLLFGYTQFHSVLLAVAVFELIQNIKWNKIIRKDKTKSILMKVSSCSFGIYLIHQIVMRCERGIL